MLEQTLIQTKQASQTKICFAIINVKAVKGTCICCFKPEEISICQVFNYYETFKYCCIEIENIMDNSKRSELINQSVYTPVCELVYHCWMSLIKLLICLI